MKHSIIKFTATLLACILALTCLAAASVPEGVTGPDIPGGDGIVSEAQVQKAYVWLYEVKTDTYATTYEELAEYFGVDGLFDHDEFNEHVQSNKRYYKWISEDNPTHFLYVNFQEKDSENKPGVYTISSYNTSGFLGSEATEAYLEEVKEEAKAADIAKAADVEMKDFEFQVVEFANNENVLTVKLQMPAEGWCFNEQRVSLVDSEDPYAWKAGEIYFDLKDKLEDFDVYRDQFENYTELEPREVDGIEMQGRTYTYNGADWTEYIAQLGENQAVSIRVLRRFADPGTLADRIIGSVTFE